MNRNTISHIIHPNRYTRFVNLTIMLLVIISGASNLSTYEGTCSIDLHNCYRATELIAIQIELSDESDTEQPPIVTSELARLLFGNRIKTVFIFIFFICFVICLFLTFYINVSFITISIISLIICVRLGSSKIIKKF